MADTVDMTSGALTLSSFGLTETCTGTNRRGQSCGREPIPGGSVCRFHGGANPLVRRKAIERLQHARDISLERYIEYVADDGDLADPRLLLDAVVTLTDKIELMEGRASQRSEVDERSHYEEVRVQLVDRLERLLGRHRAQPAPRRPTLEPWPRR